MRYEIDGELHDWVRVDEKPEKAKFSWWEDFDDKTAFFVDFDDFNWELNENELLCSIPTMSNNVVRQQKVYHTSLGAFVKHLGKRYYVLETCY